MSEKKLSLKSERFCQNWVDTTGNGTLAVLLSYDIKGKEILEQEVPYKNIAEKELTLEQNKEIEHYYKECKRIKNTAGVMASKMIRRNKITDRIDKILDERGFEDKTVKREHFKIIKQGRDEVKMRSIDSYYKLKGKNAPDKVDLSTLGKSINYNDEQARKIAGRIIGRKAIAGTSS